MLKIDYQSMSKVERKEEFDILMKSFLDVHQNRNPVDEELTKHIEKNLIPLTDDEKICHWLEFFNSKFEEVDGGE